MSKASHTMLLQQFKQALQQRYPIRLSPMRRGRAEFTGHWFDRLRGRRLNRHHQHIDTGWLGSQGPLSNALVFVDLDGDER